MRIELAAQAAARRGAPDTGAERTEQAARLTPLDTPEARRSRVIAAGELHYAGGDATRARELLEAVLPVLPRGPTRARALLHLAHASNEPAAILALLEEALDNAGDHYRLRAELEVMCSDILGATAEFGAALMHAQAALEAAERANDPGLIALATAGYAADMLWTGGSVDLEAVRRGIEYEDSAPILTTYRPSVTLAQTLFFSDDYAQARPALEQVIRLTKARGELYETSFFVLHLAWLESYAGDFEAAEQHRITSAELARDQGDYALDVLHMCGEALIQSGRGDLEAARASAVQAVEMAERIGLPLFGEFAATLLAHLDLWTGDPTAAHARLHPVRNSWVSKGFGHMGSLWLTLWWVDIEALIALDRLEEAQSVLDDLFARSTRSGNPNAVAIGERCRGLLLAARGKVKAGIDAMNAALVAHEQRRLAPEVARTLLELGVLQRRAKKKSAAKQRLEAALAIFEPMGAAMSVERARDELGRVGLRRAVVSDGLTPTQARVAGLVAAGMSNREIASTLYMSLRSVESHLTKVYRELGVKSRAQLAASLAAKAGASDADEPPTETG